jgi:GAF domain-containing protein
MESGYHLNKPSWPEIEINSQLSITQNNHSAQFLHGPRLLWEIDPTGKLNFITGAFPAGIEIPNQVKPGMSIFEVYSNLPEIIKLIQKALNGKTVNAIIQHPSHDWDYQIFPTNKPGDSQGGAIGLIQQIMNQPNSYWIQSMVLDTASELRKAQSWEEMPHLIYNKLKTTLYIDRAIIVTKIFGSQNLEITSTHGAWSQLSDHNEIKSHLTDPDLITDLLNQDSSKYKTIHYLGSTKIYGFPLFSENETSSILWIGRESPLQPHEAYYLKEISSMLARAFQRAREHERTTRNLSRLAALHSIDQAISGNFNLKLTLQIILEQVVSQLGVDAADIYLLDDETQHLIFGHSKGFLRKQQTETPPKAWNELIWKTLQAQGLLAIPDFLQKTGGIDRPGYFAAEGFQTYFALPLIAKGVSLGVIEVFHRKKTPIDQDWINFFKTLGTQAAIAIDNAKLVENLRRTNLQLDQAYQATLEGWARALNLRDQCTEKHTQRVVENTIKLAQAAGITSPQDLIHIRRGALLHDIGKLGVPDNILNKPGPLNEQEWEIMRKHPVYALEMLEPIDFLNPALPIPQSHHEKWDGSGYPEAKSGTAIPLEARVFSIIDVWDALSSPRPYRPAWPKEKIYQYIKEQSGIHFDPQLVKLWETVFQIPG